MQTDTPGQIEAHAVLGPAKQPLTRALITRVLVHGFHVHVPKASVKCVRSLNSVDQRLLNVLVFTGKCHWIGHDKFDQVVDFISEYAQGQSVVVCRPVTDRDLKKCGCFRVEIRVAAKAEQVRAVGRAKGSANTRGQSCEERQIQSVSDIPGRFSAKSFVVGKPSGKHQILVIKKQQCFRVNRTYRYRFIKSQPE